MQPQRPITARARLVAAVTDEILSRNEATPFPIASEHQLCRRFSVSRVTVRLALGDLENRGLIYRRHGKGTFAHGSATRVHRYLGILTRTPGFAGTRPSMEFIRGAQSIMSQLRSSLLLISVPPEVWRPETASSLGGVIVFPQNVTADDLDVLRNRNLPYYIFTETDMPGPRISMHQREAARYLTEQLLRRGHRRIALLSGFDPVLDAPKRLGVQEAIAAAGIDQGALPEIRAVGGESGAYRAARDVLALSPRPTAVVATDDSLGSMLMFQARRQTGLKIPDDLSIVSFHDWPYLTYIEPALTTVRFDFYQAGQRAAEALSRAALTGDAPAPLDFEPTYRAGQTMGPAPAEAPVA